MLKSVSSSGISRLHPILGRIAPVYYTPLSWRQMSVGRFESINIVIYLTSYIRAIGVHFKIFTYIELRIRLRMDELKIIF